MDIRRRNNLGQEYKILDLGNGQSQILNKTDNIIVNATVDQISQGWYYWQSGKFIQDAFPFLNPNEREFIMTGITPKQWEEIFMDDED